MKPLSTFLLLSLILFSRNLSAQEDFKRFYIGFAGTASFDQSDYELTSTGYTSIGTAYELGFHPLFAYNINPDWMLGLGFDYNTDVTEYSREVLQPSTLSMTVQERVEVNTAGLRLQARRQWLLADKISVGLSGGFSAAVEGNILISQDSITGSSSSDNISNNGNSYGVFVMPDLHLNITESFGIYLTGDLISYTYLVEKNVLTGDRGSSETELLLSPQNWRFGAFFRF